MKNKVFIIAGEPSGDLHGAGLITKLKEFDSDIEVYGIGGDLMKNAGMELLYHIDKFSFLGFAEIIKHLPFIIKVQKNVLKFIEENGTETVVLIDYPGFNLSTARKLNKMDVNVIYYISPQVWAWAVGRVKKIRKYIDKMLVVFPFEKDFYRNHGVEAEFVGHPLMEKFNRYEMRNRDEFIESNGLDPYKEILLVKPGSREQEVTKLFPEAVKAAGRLAEKFDMQVVVGLADSIRSSLPESLAPEGLDYKIVKGWNLELLRYSRFGIIKSGTSTLEAALMELPMVVIYKASPFTYWLGKKLIKVDFLGMVNLITGEQIVPELIQNDAESDKIFETCSRILENEEEYNTIKNKMSRIRGILGDRSASEESARIILSTMDERKRD